MTTHDINTLHAVRDAYGGDPTDTDWDTPQGVADIIEDLSGLARTQAARVAFALAIRDDLLTFLREWTADPTDCGCETSICRATCLPARTRAAIAAATITEA